MYQLIICSTGKLVFQIVDLRMLIDKEFYNRLISFSIKLNQIPKL